MDYYKNLSLENIEGEIWKPAVDYEIYYHVSNLGRIKRLPRKTKVAGNGTKIWHEIILKQNITKGRLYISFMVNNKKTTLAVHRMVAKAFILNPENKPQVNHIKGIKTDNRASALEWNTHTENMNHSVKNHLHSYGEKHPKAKLTEKMVLEIIKMLNNKVSCSNISKIYSTTAKSINLIKQGKNWKHLSYNLNVLNK